MDKKLPFKNKTDSSALFLLFGVLVFAAFFGVILYVISDNPPAKLASTGVGSLEGSQKYVQAYPFSQSTDHENFEYPPEFVLRDTLTDMEYKVLRQDGTEPSFDNAYWNNKEDGIYVERITGEPLFLSSQKYESGTGWPSFYRPIAIDVVTEHEDNFLFEERLEIRSRYGDNHLGHIIYDGPDWNDDIRYCMNSAALRFVPKKYMKAEGYGQYVDQLEREQEEMAQHTKS